MRLCLRYRKGTRHCVSIITATAVLFLSTAFQLAPKPLGTLGTPAQAQIPQDSRTRALQLYQQAEQQYRQGQYRDALATLQKALVLFQEVGSPTEVGGIFNNIGLLYQELGEYSQALEFLNQGLVIHKATNNGVEEGATLNNIGGVYNSLGQYAQALKFFEQALAVRQRIGDREGIGTTLNNMGHVYDALGQYAQALKSYEQALAISRAASDKAGIGVILHNIGGVYYSLRQYPQALEFLQQALVIDRELGDKANQRDTLTSIGDVYRQLGQYPQALEFHQQALVIYREVGDQQGEGTALNNIGGVYSSQGQYPQALEFYQQALAIYTKISSKAGEGLTLNNIGFVQLKTGKLKEATNTLRRVIEILESQRLGLSDANKISIFDTQADTYNLLQQALIAQNQTESALEIAERSRARAFVELLASRGATSAEQARISPPTIQEIQQIAKAKNSTLVEYSIIYDEELKLFIWVIQPTGEIAFRQVELKSSLEDLVSSSRDSIGARGRGSLATAPKPDSQTNQLQQLYQLLIQPIANLLPKDPHTRVVFIPHESLFLVPFAALQDPSGKYLIEQHTILTTPAIQVLNLTDQQRQRVSGKEMLVVGNPTMPKVGEPPEQLSRLPGAEREALEIAQLFNTKAITGNRATKSAILQQLSSARFVHLATHGLLDDFKGLGVPGAIALAPDGRDDGLLTAGEILDLKLNAELVVLSACDTGRGKITGDGVIGLSRSLILAGAPSVIVSLWSIPDAPTASLMTEFYKNLQLKPDKAAALRQAMLTTLKQHPNPIDWAAFILIGEVE